MDIIYRFNEAAALLPREATAHQAGVELAAGASMRPRHYCRGRPGDVGVNHQLELAGASMRPRHYCRGRQLERQRAQKVVAELQ